MDESVADYLLKSLKLKSIACRAVRLRAAKEDDRALAGMKGGGSACYLVYEVVDDLTLGGAISLRHD